MRRIQLLNANKPRISSVPARRRGSLSVVYASAPRIKYAINDIAKRLITSDPANKFWCTGKDSNLRTSLGGTDLQSVGFNHSPTCADTAGRCSRCPSSFSSSRHLCESTDRGSTLLLAFCHTTFTNQTFASPNFAKQGNQESRYELTARRSLHAGIVPNRVPNEVRWKNLLRHLVAETKPSAACRKPLNSLPAFHMLELAKGFEPPTP